jgi:uncharacterized protein (DUF362 family)
MNGDVVIIPDSDAVVIPSMEDVLKYFAIQDMAPNPGVELIHFCTDNMDPYAPGNWVEQVDAPPAFKGAFSVVPIPFLDIFERVMSHAEACLDPQTGRVRG